MARTPDGCPFCPVCPLDVEVRMIEAVRRLDQGFHAGLSDETKVCGVYTPPGNKGDGIVSCPGDRKMGMATDDYTLTGRIEVSRLDDLIWQETAEVPIPIGVLKMDVEDFELKVILGGIEFFTNAKIPFIAMEGWNLRHDDLLNVTALFRSLGYKLSLTSFFSDFCDTIK
jgi:hypothetical protein